MKIKKKNCIQQNKNSNKAHKVKKKKKKKKEGNKSITKYSVKKELNKKSN